MKTAELTVQTGRHRGLYDLTGRLREFVAGEGDGLLVVFVPHATAGVVVMELGAGSDADLMAALDRLLPRDAAGSTARLAGPRRRSRAALLAPPSLTVPVVGGRLTLGTWQSIALLDPNSDNSIRTVRLSFMPG